LLLIFFCRDLIAFDLSLEGLHCSATRQHLDTSWFSSAGLPNSIQTQLGLTQPGYQTQCTKTQLYVVSLARRRLYEVRWLTQATKHTLSCRASDLVTALSLEWAVGQTVGWVVIPLNPVLTPSLSETPLSRILPTRERVCFW
jgi:hypothetical protein